MGTILSLLFTIVIAWFLCELWGAICQKIGFAISGAITGAIIGFFWALVKFLLFWSNEFFLHIILCAAVGAVFMWFLHRYEFKEPVRKRKAKFAHTRRKARP